MATRRSKCAAVAAVVGLLLTTVSGGAAAGAPPHQRDGVAAVIASYEARIPELMAQEHIPGLALALVDGDRVVWQQGFGSTDSDGRTPVTVDTIFSVQSMSKAFTATAVMEAVQAGRLDLDVPITTYLPGFEVHSAFERHPEQRITLRMLLSHTAGFTHEAPLGNNYEPEPGDFDAHVRSISDTWLRFPVGTGYAYSNLGIDLAGYILEQVSQKPFPVVMRDSLLAPLGMDHSTFDRAQVHAAADRAINAVWLELALTACDLIAWAQTILLHGELAKCEPKTLRTGCCTSPPASPAANGECPCASPNTGHGGTNWPQPSPASPPSHNRYASDRQPHRCPPRPENPEQPAPADRPQPRARKPDSRCEPTNKINNSGPWPLLKDRG
jgi:CubicO group peptidase (beta-lactamase class C family)